MLLISPYWRAAMKWRVRQVCPCGRRDEQPGPHCDDCGELRSLRTRSLCRYVHEESAPIGWWPPYGKRVTVVGHWEERELVRPAPPPPPPPIDSELEKAATTICKAMGFIPGDWERKHANDGAPSKGEVPTEMFSSVEYLFDDSEAMVIVKVDGRVRERLTYGFVRSNAYVDGSFLREARRLFFQRNTVERCES